MSQVTVKKDVSGQEPLARRPGFGLSLFPSGLFNMNPFAMMRQMNEEMDRFFGAAKTGSNGDQFWSPAIELKRKNGNLVVSAELPGLKKDEIKVKVIDESLVLEGERKQEKEEKKEGYYHSERSYGRFYRTIPLPEGAQLDKISADFSNGLLEVSIPVPEAKHTSRDVPVREGVSKAAGG